MNVAKRNEEIDRVLEAYRRGEVTFYEAEDALADLGLPQGTIDRQLGDIDADKREDAA